MKILFFFLISIVFPTLDNEDMNAIINHPTKTYWYDLPRAHQKGKFSGLLSSYYNIAGSLDRFGNGNREFPWNKPGGLLSSTNSGKGKRFIYLPKPVVWYKEGNIVRWIFPPGTIVGESLELRTGDGQELPYQVRIRKKIRASKNRPLEDHWVFFVFQPFDSVESLSMALERSIMVNLREHVVSGTKFKDFVEILPEISEAPKLLTTTIFKEADIGFVWTPDTESDLCIVPKHNIIVITNDSCVSCHKNTSVHVWEFTRPSQRDWYGHIRGDDQIFSWYPFDTWCISYNGYSLPIKFSNKFPLERYNPRIHGDYIQTGGFK